MATYIELTQFRHRQDFHRRAAIAVAVTTKTINDTPTPDPLLIAWAQRTFTTRTQTSLDVWQAALADNRNKTPAQIEAGTDVQLQGQFDQLTNKYVLKGVF